MSYDHIKSHKNTGLHPLSKKYIPQKINFTGKLGKDNGATMFFIAEKQQKTIVNFSLDSLIVTE